MIAAGSLLAEGQGGAVGYYEGLLPPLLEDPRVDRVVLYHPRRFASAAAWRHPKLELRPCAVPAARPARVAYEQLAVPVRARRDRVDVLFSTANYRPLAYRRPNVVGLHAVQHFLLNDDIGRARSAYLRFAVPRSVRTADRVIAATETLRAEAVALFRVDPARIVTVPMGPSPWVRELAASEVRPHRTPSGAPYVLAISRLYALKNHARLIEAFASLRDLPHVLVIAGGDADVTRAELEDVARRHGAADRVRFLGRVAQADVPGLYAGADAAAYVSLYETFGHPVLEAFATGTPLVTSAAGATAEVAGGAARLVDPTDTAEIAAGLRDVLTDAALRERLVAAGRRRLGDFSWEDCARGTVDVLAAAAAGGQSRRGPG
jgi:glycosyltransferase involved in cell wall biosynthesis